MAGFFGFFDYSRPGPGVDVNAPPKKPFFRFWELYWRKFSRFILLNMLVFLFFLPIVAFVLQMFSSVMFDLLGEEYIAEMVAQADDSEGGIVFFNVLQSITMSAIYYIPNSLAVFLLIVSAVFYGPVMCGMTYILRNYWREEHAWMSDFFVQMKKNFFQGAAAGLLELLALTMLVFNITSTAAEGTGAALTATLPIIKYVSVFLLILVLFARNYTYAMIVTFNIKLPGIIKNAFAFAFLGLFRNFGVLALQILFIVALFIPYADVIFIPFFFFTFIGFITIFACFPLIHKHMLLPALERKKAEEEGTGLEEGN
jgi:uncharacterized membrane protein YesL